MMAGQSVGAVTMSNVPRHVTKTGHNSLKAHIFGQAPILPKRYMPLVAIISATVVTSGVLWQRMMATSPDVQISKVRRKATIPPNDSETRELARRYTAHRGAMKDAANVAWLDGPDHEMFSTRGDPKD